MITADTSKLPKLLVLGIASAALAFGAAGATSAASDTTEPAEDTTAHTEAGHTMDSAPASLAVDGSAEASSPEAEAFCAAQLEAQSAFASGDPTLIGPAVEAMTAAAPADVLPSVEGVIANAEAGPFDPAFVEAYAGMTDWMRDNCGFAQLDLAASEYTFGGFPAELPAGATIVSLENIGEEVHEVVIMRINDDVTLSVQEILELPEEESEGMATEQAFAFAFPGAVGETVTDLTPGRYVALCFLPENADPEFIAQMEGPESTEPEGANFGPPHFTLGMVHEFTVA
jgi:hypothetical protein